MKKYYLSRYAMRTIKLVLFLLSLILTCLARIFLFSYPIIMWSAYALFWGIFFVAVIIVIPVYYSKTCYYISSCEISKLSGFFISSKQLMKVSAIQYITQLSTPLSKFTGMNFLIINAFGGKMALLYLSKTDAEEILAVLSASIRKNGDK